VKGRAFPPTALAEAITTIEAMALFEGPEAPVSVRMADANGAVLIDRGDDRWDAVRISPDGWDVVPHPVRFVRTAGLKPLPAPERGGTLDTLRDFLNPGLSNNDFRLILAWMVAGMLPRGPYPVLILTGAPGSAKSTTARVLRALIDPNRAPLRFRGRDGAEGIRELFISAANGRVLSIDNLSGSLSPLLSNALCSISTGAGYSTRTLYENGEESIFQVCRPVILNGIDEVATAPDLLDRALVVDLPPVPEDRRQTESAFEEALTRESPRLLGALYDTLARVLAVLPEIRPGHLPRMADFARVGMALEKVLDWAPGAFMAAYGGKQQESLAGILENSEVGKVLVGWLDDQTEWSGTLSELLTILTENAPEGAALTLGWPRTPRALAGEMKRLTAALRSVGVVVEEGHHPRTRRKILKITRRQKDKDGGEDPSHPSHSSKCKNINDLDAKESEGSEPCEGSGEGSGEGCEAKDQECEGTSFAPRSPTVATSMDAKLPKDLPPLLTRSDRVKKLFEEAEAAVRTPEDVRRFQETMEEERRQRRVAATGTGITKPLVKGGSR